jgi:hypothetical protein
VHTLAWTLKKNMIKDFLLRHLSRRMIDDNFAVVHLLT